MSESQAQQLLLAVLQLTEKVAAVEQQNRSYIPISERGREEMKDAARAAEKKATESIELIQALRIELLEYQNEYKEELRNLRTELQSEISVVRDEVHVVRDDINNSLFNRTVAGVVSFGTAVVVVLNRDIALTDVVELLAKFFGRH